MTSPADRPAAELLAEWSAQRWYYSARALAGKRYGEVLRRLVLAEQALAAVENLCERGDRGMIEAQRQVGHVPDGSECSFVLTRDLRAAVRAEADRG